MKKQALSIMLLAVAILVGCSSRVQPTQEGVTKQLKRQGFQFMQIGSVNKTNPDGSDAGKELHYICAKRSPAVKAVLSICKIQKDECVQVMLPLNAAEDCVAFAKSLSSALKPTVRELLDKPLPPRVLKVPGGSSVFTVTNCPTSPDGTAIVIRHVSGDHPFPQDDVMSSISIGISAKFGSAENIPLPE